MYKFICKLFRPIFRFFNYQFARANIIQKNRDLEKISSTQKKAIEVVFELLKDKENDLLIAPISSKYYIKNDDIGIFVVIYYSNDPGGFVSIISSKYHYDIWLENVAIDHIVHRFRKVIERRRAQMESEIRTKVDRSLETIYKTLKEEHEIKELKTNKINKIKKNGTTTRSTSQRRSDDANSK